MTEKPHTISMTFRGVLVPGVEPAAQRLSETAGEAAEPVLAIELGGELYTLLMSDGGGKTVCVDFDGVLSKHEGPFEKDECGPVIEDLTPCCPPKPKRKAQTHV